MLKPWTPGFQFEQGAMCKVYIGVSFPNLNLSFWFINGLSKVAGAIGMPLFADMCTAFKERIAYARVLVEADVSTTLPDVIPFRYPFDDFIDQRVH